MKEKYMFCVFILIYLINVSMMANDNSIILLEKELRPNLDVTFSYEFEKGSNVHNWQLTLQNKKNNEKIILDSFSYEESQLPFLLTPDVWQNTIYKLFSCLDAVIINSDGILVLYDVFGDVYFTNYKIDADNRIINKNLFPVKKYNLSFLLGYESSYGRILGIENEIYAYYSVAAPPRQNLICLSLEKKDVTQIDFDNNINLIKENDPSILNAICPNNNKIISQHLSNILHRPIHIYGGIEDLNANKKNGRGIIYYFSKQNKELLILRYNRLMQEWVIGNYTTIELN